MMKGSPRKSTTKQPTSASLDLDGSQTTTIRRSQSREIMDRMSLEQQLLDRPGPDEPYDPSFFDDDDYHLGPNRGACGRRECRDACVGGGLESYVCSAGGEDAPEDDAHCCAPPALGGDAAVRYSTASSAAPNVTCF